MKYILIISVLFNFVLYSQNVDTIIQRCEYTSYFSLSLKTPLYVKYTLFNGGGDISRPNNFKSEKITLSDDDYKYSGYDRGHLVPAEDFAYDTLLLNETFEYINVLPQYPNLNRGQWKKYENYIRKVSKEDTLTIIAGGARFIKDNNLYVPTIMYKIVLQDGIIIGGLLFTNKKEDNQIFKIDSIFELEDIINYKLDI